MQNYSSSLDRNPFALSRLGINEIGGFIRGFIDVVFTINGKWYLADWKSNHLGDNEDAYCKEKLECAMAAHFYHLQYHIYAVALHRHLQRALPSYDYEDHFGGVFYFFVRGIHQKKHDSGIFFDRPSKDTIDRLDAYFRRSIA